jgi:acetyltransferase-like isoleucine patch superfamily enzyme
MLKLKQAWLRSLSKTCRDFALARRPFGLASLGLGSAIQWPSKLHGRRSIRVGSQTLIRSYAYMDAISAYAGRQYHPAIEIGDNVYIGRHVYLTACDRIVISNGCVLSEHVYISDLAHGLDPQNGPIMKQPIESRGGVHLGPNCFLGYRAVILPGVSLGEWCVVGANSVVTRSFPAFSMIAGSPAKLVKVYAHDLRQWVKPGGAPERSHDEV